MPGLSLSPLCEVFSCFQVFRLLLVSERFFLERDILVRLASVNEQPDYPLEEIYDIEEHVQEFFHLRRVYRLVCISCFFIRLGRSRPSVFPHEK